MANAQLGKAPVAPSAPLSQPPTQHQVATVDLNVTELFNEFLRAKVRANCSDRYLRALRNSLSKFQSGRARLPIGQVTPQLIDYWISKNSQWKPRTVKGYVGDLSAAFGYAVRRGYLSLNPVKGIEKPRGEAGAPPQIHTPEQCAKVLQEALKADPVLCRALAIRYFAGVRSAEVQRLNESHILPSGYIEVPAKAAKTRARRLVPISENLRAWIDATKAAHLPIGDMGNRQRLFVRAIGEPWPNNVARHSFISYRLALIENAGKVALEAGNSESMVFGHYRELVTKAAALAYFAISPPV